mmetsp:Transcript_14839/g.44830  ORF Transcript_14839/g.44830 Transcript_14839/m.44830 type:complete len:203 (+) Transcript_14839:679-1287(+)
MDPAGDAVCTMAARTYRVSSGSSVAEVMVHTFVAETDSISSQKMSQMSGMFSNRRCCSSRPTKFENSLEYLWSVHTSDSSLSLSSSSPVSPDSSVKILATPVCIWTYLLKSSKSSLTFSTLSSSFASSMSALAYALFLVSSAACELPALITWLTRRACRIGCGLKARIALPACCVRPSVTGLPAHERSIADDMMVSCGAVWC